MWTNLRWPRRQGLGQGKPIHWTLFVAWINPLNVFDQSSLFPSFNFELDWPQATVSSLRFTAYNFSHRIDHLSFGEELPGIINPLDGTEKITYSSKSQLFSQAIEGWPPNGAVSCRINGTLVESQAALSPLYMIGAQVLTDCTRKEVVSYFSPENSDFLTFFWLQITRCSSTSSPWSPPNWTRTRYPRTPTSSLWQSGWEKLNLWAVGGGRVSANCQKTHRLFVSPGAGDKPRGGQPRRLWHLCEVRHQLPDGDGQRAAHAAVAVPGATVRHRRRDFLHDGQVPTQLFSKSGHLTHRFIPSLPCSSLQACSTALWDSVSMSSAVASSLAPIDPERWELIT